MSVCIVMMQKPRNTPISKKSRRSKLDHNVYMNIQITGRSDKPNVSAYI
jgi:hypothetical protein